MRADDFVMKRKGNATVKFVNKFKFVFLWRNCEIGLSKNESYP